MKKNRGIRKLSYFGPIKGHSNILKPFWKEKFKGNMIK